MADSTCASQKTKPFEYFPTEHASWLRSALYCEINLSVLRSSPPESARAPASHCQRSCVSDPGLLLGDQELHELGLFLLVRLNPWLVKRVNPDVAYRRLSNLLKAWKHEIKEMLGGMGINSLDSLRSNRLMLRGINLDAKEREILGVLAPGE